MSDKPECGAPCTQKSGRCEREVPHEEMYCQWHQFADLPALEHHEERAQ